MKLLSMITIFSIFLLPFGNVIAKQRKHIVIPKIGVYEMKNEYTAGFQYDTGSSSVYGFEYERRFKTGLTIGTEYMHFNNKTTPQSVRLDLDVDVYFFTFKYYINYREKGLSPFIGVGHGYAIADGAHDGQAYQAMLGLSYDWERVGMYFQYKRMYSKIDRDSIEYLVAAGPEIDISGQGLFAGVSVRF